eukprot:752932-Hanusia_phi.AAC.4
MSTESLSSAYSICRRLEGDSRVSGIFAASLEDVKSKKNPYADVRMLMLRAILMLLQEREQSEAKWAIEGAKLALTGGNAKVRSLRVAGSLTCWTDGDQMFGDVGAQPVGRRRVGVSFVVDRHQSSSCLAQESHRALDRMPVSRLFCGQHLSLPFLFEFTAVLVGLQVQGKLRCRRHSRLPDAGTST